MSYPMPNGIAECGNSEENNLPGNSNADARERQSRDVKSCFLKFFIVEFLLYIFDIV